MQIRQSLASDRSAVEAVHQFAFGGTADGPTVVEVRLLRALRRDAGWVPQLSLVAVDQDDRIIGYVVSTEGRIADTTVLGMGPLGVLPERQGAGVGAALVEHSLRVADELGYPLVALLGHTPYYPRFGFVPAASLGVGPPRPEWAEHFQARPLSVWRPELTGQFSYAAPFAAL